MFPSTYGGRIASEKPRGHGQQANSAMMNCSACRGGDCSKCPDKTMMLLNRPLMCSCKKSGHEEAITGEPRQNQVEDPFTGDVHGPGIRVSQEGVVERTTSADSTPYEGS